MKQKDKISCWNVKIIFKVRTKKQAIELDKAMVDLYNKKVSEWTGVKAVLRKDPVMGRYDINL